MKRRNVNKSTPGTEDTTPRTISHNTESGRSLTRWCLYGFLVTSMASVVLIYILPSNCEPVEFQYSTRGIPELVGPLSVNNHLKQARRLFENQITGPEGIATDSNGDIYTGLSDGRIIRLSKDLSSFTTVTRTGEPPYEDCGNEMTEKECGRPLGMQFHHTEVDDLYVADSSLGLLRVNVGSGNVQVLLPVGTKLGENEILFLNDLVILKNDTIFITESSYKFNRADNRFEVLECSDNGRLLYYNILDKSYGVVMDNFHFSNGICLSHDGDSLLIAETTRARILRYYLFGPKSGDTDVFAENLPGLPDNISPSSTGSYWIGIAHVRTSAYDFFASATGAVLRRIVSKWSLLFDLIRMVLPKHGLVLELDVNGNIVRSFHDQGGDITPATSHVLDRGDSILIGSFFAPFLLELDL